MKCFHSPHLPLHHHCQHLISCSLHSCLVCCRSHPFKTQIWTRHFPLITPHCLYDKDNPRLFKILPQPTFPAFSLSPLSLIPPEVPNHTGLTHYSLYPILLSCFWVCFSCFSLVKIYSAFKIHLKCYILCASFPDTSQARGSQKREVAVLRYITVSGEALAFNITCVFENHCPCWPYGFSFVRPSLQALKKI